MGIIVVMMRSNAEVVAPPMDFEETNLGSEAFPSDWMIVLLHLIA